MSFAFSGGHATGKSTLIAQLSAWLPGYAIADETYATLAEEGVVFAAYPSQEDFDLLLERSCALLAANHASDLLLDRCPADYLGYLHVGPTHDADLMPPRIERATRAMASLDLVVFVAIERPDRISVGEFEHPRLRRRVDAALREILVADAWGLGAHVLEVNGTPDERA